MKYHLLGVGTDAKTIKGQKLGWTTGILYLSPADFSGKNLCPHSSPGCRLGCLNTAGRGAFESVQNARLRKTRMFLEQRREFLELLAADITLLKLQHRKVAVRLNGTSDIAWESVRPTSIGTPTIIDRYSSVQFYDYTKNKTRMLHSLRDQWPSNYRLVFSRSEANELDCLHVLEAGGNVAAVFSDGLPDTWYGYRVIDGDEHDLRFLDPKGVVVGLKAKGEARKDSTGFVITNN